MSDIQEKFFSLLRYALLVEETDPQIKDEEWSDIFTLAERHSLLGVVFHGIQKSGLKPPQNVFYQWLSYSEQIKALNIEVNKAAVELTGLFKQNAFCSCILKGQGNAFCYPNPYSRTPGDIDIWVKPKGDEKSKNEEIRWIIEFVKGSNSEGVVMYHHVDYGDYNGVEVEVHYRPSFMFNPIHNQRLQKWFIAHSEEQFRHEVELPDGVGKVAIPTPKFNIVFQLSHIYNHVLHEGIGLRQFVDYYFVLRQIEDTLRLPLYKGRNLKETLRYLGLWKFAGAVMYVMREVFALDEQYMIAPVDERRGKVLLQEIMRGGNFGKYDEANIKANSRIKKNVQRIKRDIRMMRYFPSECIWEPAFRGYHFFWRLAHK